MRIACAVMPVLVLLPASLLPAADVILNEYNAVSGSQFLDGGASDTFWGRVAGNGGDWFEVAVISDHLDMRGWRLVIRDISGVDITLTLTSHPIWSDLRSGTILTVAEDLGNNVDDYAPALGKWWLNVKAADDTDGTYITATNFPVNNDNWQLTILDDAGAVVFGPAGEGIRPPGGVGSTEVCKLEENPSALITPLSNYQDGTSSTFGSPNVWSGGAGVQDFSALRSVLPYHPLTGVTINEVLSHSEIPLVDWIELHNLSGEAIDVSGWYLSDRIDTLTLFAIPPDTQLPAHGYATFDETVLNFALDAAYGDEVYLSEADSGGVMTGGRTYVEFGPAATGVSFGRFPNGVGNLYRMTERTPGSRNAEPVIGPVVVNEIMYHPPDIQPGGIDNLDDEFIELHNVAPAAANLFTYFAEADETHPWRLTTAVDFSFSLDTTIAGYGFLLVVSFDPVLEPAKLAAFRATYGLDASVPIVGPYTGRLSNSGDSVQVRRPDTPQPPGQPDEGFVPYVLVDDVPYTDDPPWPTGPDGSGASLERIEPTFVGDLASNWRVSASAGGSPGSVNSCPGDGDHDGDGDVDLVDFHFFAECLTGPGMVLARPRCACFDVDADGDTDLADCAVFVLSFTG